MKKCREKSRCFTFVYNTVFKCSDYTCACEGSYISRFVPKLHVRCN